MTEGVREDTTIPTPERRGEVRNDRRKNSRSGRRTSDPRSHWWRLTWLFAGYALYISARSLPEALRDKIFRRSPPTPS
jgi:hypothetical protein